MLRRSIISLTLISLTLSLQTGQKCAIKICHSKDCTKKGGGERLFQTFQDLLPTPPPSNEVRVPSIERSGCLSQCGKGPNISVIKSGKDEKIYFGVLDVTTASAILDVATGAEYPIQLLVAADLIFQVDSANAPAKKEHLLTSAITQLSEDENTLLLNSYAHGHALYLRADARLEKSPPDIAGAINDARMAVQIVSNEIKAWRVLASAYEAGGNFEGAISAVKEWEKVDASFATKAKRELERLSSLL